jgi:hypothetical protein
VPRRVDGHLAHGLVNGVAHGLVNGIARGLAHGLAHGIAHGLAHGIAHDAGAMAERPLDRRASRTVRARGPSIRATAATYCDAAGVKLIPID